MASTGMDVLVAAILVCGVGGEEGTEAGRTKAAAVARNVPSKRKNRVEMPEARLLVVLVVTMALCGCDSVLMYEWEGNESLALRCKNQKPPPLAWSLE